jgi:ATP-dependent exoDNAse (exonuclease V) alpha subunit
VIVPVFPSRVLSREWLYTVVTRARERCYLIGDVKAIQGCIRVQRANERRTGLVDAITRTVEV